MFEPLAVRVPLKDFANDLGLGVIDDAFDVPVLPNVVVRTKEGRQRQALQARLTRIGDALQGRIHGFNVSAAQAWAEQERLLEFKELT